MSPPAPILLPLDGSATAEAALPWAARFAIALEHRLVLLRLISTHDLQPEEDPAPALRVAQHYLDGVALSLRRANIAIETRVAPVDPHVSAGITGVAESLHAVLLVLAGHGRSGPERWMLGSVADEVIRTASQPVLIMRGTPTAPSESPAIRRILLPLDGSALAEAALPEAIRLATAFGATLDLVRMVAWSLSLISAPAEEDERDAAMYLRGIQARLPEGVQSERHVGQYMLHSNPADSIVNLAHWSNTDLIVMTSHGRSGWRRWVLGSVADAVVRSSECPVYLLRSTAPAGPPASASR